MFLFRKAVKELEKEKGLDLTDLAGATGINVHTLRQYFAYDNVSQIHEGRLRMALKKFMGQTDEPAPAPEPEPVEPEEVKKPEKPKKKRARKKKGK